MIDWRGYRQLDLFSWLPQSEQSLYLLLCLLAVSASFLIVGYRCRASAFAGYLLVLTLETRGHHILNAGHTLLALMLLYLSISPCGQALSIDSCRANRQSGRTKKSQ